MSPLVEIIAREAAAEGVLPFSRFMELALYCPDYGFYERDKDSVGRRGDFYTSVSVGPLFGQLLAFQFVEWFAGHPAAGSRLRIVEAGVHDGQLAKDVLDWFRECRADLFQGLEYCIVEPSARRRTWQAEKLAEFGNQVRWLAKMTDLNHSPLGSSGRQPFTLCFANEFLDAFPVHRLGWDSTARTWFEWGVAAEGDRFRWERRPPSVPLAALTLPTAPALLDALPDGFTTEVSPEAEAWWGTAAARLAPGKLLTIDYGLAADEFFLPERHRGTLRTYRRHQVGDDALRRVGEQDITANVNFTALEAAGQVAGLKTELWLSQAKFLTQIAAHAWKPGSGFGEWTASRSRQFQTLTHPEHLGRRFQALVQAG